jgi:hypothetical protein
LRICCRVIHTCCFSLLPLYEQAEREETEAEILRRQAVRGISTPQSETLNDETEKDDNESVGSSASRRRHRNDSKADFIRTYKEESDIFSKSLAEMTATSEQARVDAQKRWEQEPKEVGDRKRIPRKGVTIAGKKVGTRR